MRLVDMATDSLITVLVRVIEIFLKYFWICNFLDFKLLFILGILYVPEICLKICGQDYIGISFWSIIISFWT